MGMETERNARRTQGRLRKLTPGERSRRQARRERLNPSREARKRNMRGRLIFEAGRNRPVGVRKTLAQVRREYRERVTA